MNISDPASPYYGKPWSATDVRETFSPSPESERVVRAWLADAGIEDVVEKRGWLSYNATIAHAESLMQSQYYEHGDHDSGSMMIGCDK